MDVIKEESGTTYVHTKLKILDPMSFFMPQTSGIDPRAKLEADAHNRNQFCSSVLASLELYEKTKNVKKDIFNVFIRIIQADDNSVLPPKSWSHEDYDDWIISAAADFSATTTRLNDMGLQDLLKDIGGNQDYDVVFNLVKSALAKYKISPSYVFPYVVSRDTSQRKSRLYIDDKHSVVIFISKMIVTTVHFKMRYKELDTSKDTKTVLPYSRTTIDKMWALITDKDWNLKLIDFERQVTSALLGYSFPDLKEGDILQDSEKGKQLAKGKKDPRKREADSRGDDQKKKRTIVI